MRPFLNLLLLILLTGGTVAGQSSERILIPFFTQAPIEGAFGSQWTTELSLLNDSGQDLAIAGYDQGCQLGSCPPAPTPPGITFFPVPSVTRLQGAYLQVFPSSAIDDVKIHLRARDLSRQNQDWGSEVPTIAESQAPRGRFTLLDLPNDPGYRLMLRLYYFGEGTAQARVRFYEIVPTRRHPFGLGVTPDRLLAEEVLTFTSGSLTSPGYAQLVNFAERYPELIQAMRMRIDIENLSDESRIWGLLSITNNETQHVTYVTP